jgi:hypothetical protein
MGGDVKPGAISIAFQNISAILGPDDLASLSAQFNDAIPPAAVAQAVAGRTVRAELGHNVYQGQIKGNQVLPGRITLLTKPPLPAAGGVPVIAAAAPVVATDGTPPSDPPPPAAPAVPAPGAVAAPVVEAPAAAPVPVAETAAPAQPTVEELQAQLAALQAAGTGEAVPAPATAAGTPIPVADPSF